MNKQELIDEAVEELNGILPDSIYGKKWSDLGYDGHVYLIYNGSISLHKVKKFIKESQEICTAEEFQQRAKELGWVNGYKWGVEYPTNGKKPHLPDGLFVEVVYEYGTWSDPVRMSKNWFWGTLSAFRIVDERYKPVEQKEVISLNHTEWYDYEQQKAIALPPVGVGCEVLNKSFGDGATWLKCIIHWIGEFVLVYTDESCSECCAGKSILQFRPLDHATRTKELEKNRVVDAVLDAIDGKGIAQNEFILKKAYDKGFLKLPENNNG